MQLTRQSDGRKFDGVLHILEVEQAEQAKCKHSKVRATAIVTGKPYPARIRAGVHLICERCHLTLASSYTDRFPAELLKGKRFNRQ
jgi:hypothetical protein